MRKKNVQMSFEDIYNGVSESMENRKSELVSLLEEHINLDELIPHSFHTAFYSRMGRGHPRQQHLLFRKNNIKQNLRIEGSLKHHFLFTETPILCLINQSKGSFT